MQLHDTIALLQDMPKQGLKRGQVGTLVEQWTDDVYEVEFSDNNGVTYAMAAIPAEQMLVLQWQPEKASNMPPAS